ncbi:MAG: PAS domain S-box protein [Desulfuromonadales bacterium]
MDAVHSIHIEPDEFRTMFTTSLDGFLIVAVTGHILEANDSYGRMVGYSREELINMHISEIDAIESPVDVSKRAEEIVQSGALRFETRHRHKNGSIIEIEVCSNYSPAHGGMFFSCFRDITEHKRYETALRQSEERYRNIVENQTEFVDRYLPGGILTYVNESLVKFTGLPKEKILGRSFYPFLHEADREETIRLIGSISIDNPIVKTENRIALPDGKIRWNRWTHTGFFDDGGALIEYQSVGRDITDRKAAEDALAESKEKYRAMIEAFDGYVYICSKDYRIEFMNNRLIERTGHGAVGEYCYKALHNLDSECGWCVNDIVQSGESVRWELKSPKDGCWYDICNTPILNADGTISKQAMITDITQRKTIEEELKKSEEKFRALFEQSQDAVLITLPDGKIISANQAACKMFGMTEQELCRLGRDGIVDSSDPRLLPALEERNNTGQLCTELTCIRKGGEKFPAEVSSVITSIEPLNSFVIIRDITERRQAELALQKLSSEMQRVLETSATGLTRCSRDLYYISANTAYAKLTGVLRDQIVGRPIVEVMGEEGLAAIMPHVERVLHGERVEFEIPVPFRGSDAQYLHVIYTPDEDEHGDIIGWVASVTDITGRKRAENAIKESNANFASLASNVPGFVALVDAKTLKYQYVNDEYLKSFGMHRNRIIGSHIKEVLSEANYQYALPYIEEVRSGKPASYEMTFNLVAGMRWIQVNFNPVFNETGQVVSITVLSYDITERKQSEVFLQESEERYRKFSQLTSDFVHRCQRSPGEPFRIKWMGGAVEKITGYTQEELFAKGCWLSVVHPEDRQRISDMLLRLVPGDTSKNEFRIITKSGEIGWLFESLLCEAGDKPGLLVLYGTSQDITDKKRVEEERHILENQLQQTQRLESLGVLAGGIAHDFNNILAIIMGRCSLTEMNYEKAPDHIPEIEKAVARAAELCRQMLAYAGKAQFVQTQVNIGELVEEIVTMLKTTIRQNVVIKPTIAIDIPSIKADASQIRQIAMNLIINGAEAIGDAQGEVQVTLSKISIKTGSSEKDYLGKIIPAGWYACLEVTDNGSGMSVETYNRIFEPFYTTKFTGRGLGMSSVLGIVTAQGGALQLFTHPGRGTTFKVYLPLQMRDVPANETHKLPGHQESWLGSGTILLVEDEDQILQVAKAMLMELGFRVIEARNGKEAIEQYQKNTDDINMVLTDMGMPVMDGYALFNELKKRNPALPIIISSGFGDTDITSRIPRNNIAGLIGKPYNFNLLRNALKSVMEGMP